jgi:uncharacterized protein with HEPN domain
MAQSSPVPRLTDIIEAVELIRSEMAGVTLAAFEPDRRERWLVERGIEIICEASRHLSGELKDAAPDPAQPVPRGFRSRLPNHNYPRPTAVAHGLLTK